MTYQVLISKFVLVEMVRQLRLANEELRGPTALLVGLGLATEREHDSRLRVNNLLGELEQANARINELRVQLLTLSGGRVRANQHAPTKKGKP